jgi:hypothetical protein
MLFVCLSIYSPSISILVRQWCTMNFLLVCVLVLLLCCRLYWFCHSFYVANPLSGLLRWRSTSFRQRGIIEQISSKKSMQLVTPKVLTAHSAIGREVVGRFNVIFSLFGTSFISCGFSCADSPSHGKVIQTSECCVAFQQRHAFWVSSIPNPHLLESIPLSDWWECQEPLKIV